MPCILLYNKGGVGPEGTQITKVCTNVHTCMYICHLAPPPPDPREMVISKTNISPSVCSYLDLLISVYKGKFKIKLFDKRDDYKFKVFSYPYLDGNIPETLSYGIFISQLIRFCSINSTFIGFHKDVKSLVVKLCKQGFKLAAFAIDFISFISVKLTYGENMVLTSMIK